MSEFDYNKNILSVINSLEKLVLIRDDVHLELDRSLNSDSKTQILKELWTSLDDSIKHLDYSLDNLRRYRDD